MASTWQLTSHTDQPFQRVSTHGGLVIAMGPNQLFRLRPREDVGAVREPPFPGPLRAVAVDPSAARIRSYAVASDALLAVFSEEDPTLFRHMAIQKEDPKPMQLAWCQVDGEPTLHVATDLGRLYSGGYGLIIPLVSTAAITNDAHGRFGALVVPADEDELEEDEEPLAPGVYVTDDGSAFQFRTMSDVPDCGSHCLAIMGDVAAVVLESGEPTRGLWVSRALDAPFEQLLDDEYLGPIAFDDAGGLFVVRGFEDREEIVRVDVTGNASVIVELRHESGPARVGDVAWDSSRSTLWIASETNGLLALIAPSTRLS